MKPAGIACWFVLFIWFVWLNQINRRPSHPSQSAITQHSGARRRFEDRDLRQRPPTAGLQHRCLRPQPSNLQRLFSHSGGRLRFEDRGLRSEATASNRGPPTSLPHAADIQPPTLVLPLSTQNSELLPQSRRSCFSYLTEKGWTLTSDRTSMYKKTAGSLLKDDDE